MSRYIDADALKKRVEDSNKSAGLHLEDCSMVETDINVGRKDEPQTEREGE